MTGRPVGKLFKGLVSKMNPHLHRQRYSTVMIPFIPAGVWPGKEQTKG